jgi:hypothetical protein
VLVVSGLWQSKVNGDFYLNIAKTYVYHNGSVWVCSPENPKMIHNVGVLAADTEGGKSPSGIYASGAANNAPYSGWSAEYAPETADCIKLVRGGNTYSIGNTGAGMIIKIGDTRFFIKCEEWLDNWTGTAYYPLVAGDMLIVEGDFIGKLNEGDGYDGAVGHKIRVTKTWISYDGTTFTFSDSEPIPGIPAGPLLTHTDSFFIDVVWAGMADNSAPYGDGVEYAPMEAENYQVIRSDGTVVNIGIPGRGTLLKENNSKYGVKALNGPWCIDGVSITTDDILVVSGL